MVKLKSIKTKRKFKNFPERKDLNKPDLLQASHQQTE